MPKKREPVQDEVSRQVAAFRARHLTLDAGSLDITEHAQGYAATAVETAASIMVDPTISPKVRLDAASIILDRAYGKPGRALPDDSWIESMSDEQLESAVSQILDARKKQLPGGRASRNAASNKAG